MSTADNGPADEHDPRCLSLADVCDCAIWRQIDGPPRPGEPPNVTVMREIEQRECSCTPLPNAEGPCSWCDVHGQPSAAWDQGVAEGRHNERVIANLEIRDLGNARNELVKELRAERDRLSAELARLRRDGCYPTPSVQSAATFNLPAAPVPVSDQPEPPEVTERFAHLRTLPENWDSYGGRPIQAGVEPAMQQILASLRKTPYISATSNGGIEAMWRDSAGDEVLTITAEPGCLEASFGDDVAAYVEALVSGPDHPKCGLRYVHWISSALLCDRRQGHDGLHRAVTPNGNGVEWPDVSCAAPDRPDTQPAPNADYRLADGRWASDVIHERFLRLNGPDAQPPAESAADVLSRLRAESPRHLTREELTEHYAPLAQPAPDALAALSRVVAAWNEVEGWVPGLTGLCIAIEAARPVLASPAERVGEETPKQDAVLLGPEVEPTIWVGGELAYSAHRVASMWRQSNDARCALENAGYGGMAAALDRLSEVAAETPGPRPGPTPAPERRPTPGLLPLLNKIGIDATEAWVEVPAPERREDVDEEVEHGITLACARGECSDDCDHRCTCSCHAPNADGFIGDSTAPDPAARTLSDAQTAFDRDNHGRLRSRRRSFGDAVRYLLGLNPETEDGDVLAELAVRKHEALPAAPVPDAPTGEDGDA